MGWILGVLVLGLVILIHEFGHFCVAKMFGVEILEFCIGIRIPKLPGISLKLFKFKGTQFSLNPILIGGFVRVKDEAEMDKLSRSAQCAVYIAGPLTNSIIAGILFGLAFPITNQDIPTVILGFSIGILMGFLGTLALIPLLIIAVMGSMGWDAFGGPVTIVHTVEQVIQMGTRDVLLMIAMLNMSIGAINLLPAGFLDGGHILKVLFSPLIEKNKLLWYVSVVISYTFGFLVIHGVARGLLNDLLKMYNWFLK